MQTATAPHTSPFLFTARSPLRYPGGKTRAVAAITSYFPKNLKEVVAPFVGGGSIELYLAAQGVRVHAYDAFEPLVNFWKQLLTNAPALSVEVEHYFPLEKKKFYQLQQEQCEVQNDLKRAAVFYVLNRASFSGSTLSGGMSPQHPRFTLSSIERIKNFCNLNICVEVADFKESLTEHTDAFAYLDPPYLIKNNLYGQRGSTHKDFDHEALAAILTKRKNWILSYNDCSDIRKMYKDFHIKSLKWKYGMSSNKNSSEVLIFSKKRMKYKFQITNFKSQVSI